MLRLKSLIRLDQSWTLTNAVNTPIGQDHPAATVMIGCQIHCATNSSIPKCLIICYSARRDVRRHLISDFYNFSSNFLKFIEASSAPFSNSFETIFLLLNYLRHFFSSELIISFLPFLPAKLRSFIYLSGANCH